MWPFKDTDLSFKPRKLIVAVRYAGGEITCRETVETEDQFQCRRAEMIKLFHDWARAFDAATSAKAPVVVFGDTAAIPTHLVKSVTMEDSEI